MNTDSRTPSGVTLPYRRLMPLSEGGMGQVDLCVREGGRFRRLYAMKRLKPAIRDDQDCRSMFVEEARLAGLVHHPNVVSVLDVGEDEEGPFLVMEYVEGITASDILSQASRQYLLIPISVCLEIAAQAARGLAQAHAQKGHDGTPLKLVHRDVSPHNILVDFNGVARVTDFGIARATGSSHKTSTGVLKGKLGYMAPEVLQFAPVDPRTDIFALGVVLFELLAGRRLYGGDDHERARRIVNEPAPDIGEERPDVPPSVQGLLVSMLAKERDERPASTLVVAEQLERELDRLRPDPDYCGLREYVEEHFQDVRHARRLKIQASLDEREVSGRAARSRKKAALAGAAGLVLLSGVGAAWAMTTSPSAPLPADKQVQLRPVDETPAVVVVQVNSTPSGARVVGPGVDTRTPASFTLPRGDSPIQLSVRRSGYRTHSLQIVPAADAEFDVDLVRVRRRRRAMRAEPTEPAGLREIWD